MANEILIKVKATDEGLREDLKAKVEAASAALGINVPVKVELDKAAYLKDLTAMYSAGMGLPEPKVKLAVDEEAARSSGRKAAQDFNAAFIQGSTLRTGLGALQLPLETIIPAIAAIGQLSGALGLIPAAGAAAGAGLATVAIGLNGVLDVVKAYTQAQDAAQGRTATVASQQLATANSLISAREAVAAADQAAGDAERSYTDSLISSREALASAIQAANNAEVTADENVEAATQAVGRAEDSLTSSKQAALRAEQNLTDARLSAQRALEDAPNKVIDARIANEQAINDLQKAQSAITTAQQQQQATLKLTAQGLVSIPAPIVPAPDTQGMNIALEQARQRVDETGLAYQRAQEDADTLTKAGVDGAKQVVSAQDQLQAAQTAQENAIAGVAQAQENLTRTTITGDQSIAASKQRVGDAQRALTNVMITGDEQVGKSTQAVQDAIRAQNAAILASQAAAESAAGSMAAFNDRVSKLAPNAQDAVHAVLDLRQEWRDLTADVQQHLFIGMGADIRQVAAADLPVLHTGLDRIATSIAYGTTQFAAWASNKQTVGELGVILGNVADATHNVGDLMRPVLDIITTIATVGSQFLPGIVQSWTQMATKAADFIDHARDSGQLAKWMQEGIDAVDTLWHILLNVGGILKDIMGAPHDGGLLTILLQVTGAVKWMLDNFPLLVPILESIFLANRVLSFLNPIIRVVQVIRDWGVVQWILNAALDASPLGVVLLAVGALAAAGYLIYKNWSTIGPMFTDLWHGIVASFKWGVNGVITLLNGLIVGINALIHGANWVSFGAISIPDIPEIPHWLASGGIASGLAVVGEHGPELVRLPQGSQVIPTGQSQQMMQSGALGGPPVQVQVTIHSDGTQFGAAVLEAVRYSVRVNGGDPTKVLAP